MRRTSIVLLLLATSGCGQIIEVPVELVGTSTSADGESGDASDGAEVGVADEGSGSTSDLDTLTSTGDGGEDSDGAAIDRLVYCSTEAIKFAADENDGVAVATFALAEIPAGATSLRVGVRAQLPDSVPLSIVVAHGVASAVLVEGIECGPGVSFSFGDDATVPNLNACDEQSTDGVVAPMDELANVEGDPSVDWTVTLTQDGAIDGTVDSVCISFLE